MDNEILKKKFLQELQLTTTSESELIQEQMSEVIEQAAKEENLRALCKYYKLTEGSSLKIDFATKNNMSVVRIAEGGAVNFDRTAYSQREFTPYVYGVAPLITDVMIEDSHFDVIKDNIAEAGYQLARNENTLIVAALAAGAAITAGHAFNSSGTELAISDMIAAIRLLKIQGWEANTMLIHPTQEAELALIDSFMEADKSGISDPSKYLQHRILNMDVYVHLACTENKVYIFDRTKALALVERRPLTIVNFKDDLRLMTGMVVTERLAISYLQASAITEITVV